MIKGVLVLNIKYYTQPYEANGKAFFIGEQVNNLLKSKKPFYNKVWIVASFAKKSGMIKLKTAIKKAVKSGAELNFILGTNNRLTTYEALKEILDLGCMGKIFRNISGNSIGAKLYCFEAAGERAEVLIASGNITEGGLYKNNEIVVHISYDIVNGDESSYYEFRNSVERLLEPKNELISDLSEELINILLDNGEIVYETEHSETKKINKKQKVNKLVSQEYVDTDLLSIVLPTGDSIEISLDEFEDVGKKFEKMNEDKKREEQIETCLEIDIDDEEIKEEETDEIDIEIECTENLNMVPDDLVNNLVIGEFSDYNSWEARAEGNDENIRSNEEENFISQYEVIDIEQMLYVQSHAQEHNDKIEGKEHSAISEDNMMLIRTKETKASPRKTRKKLEMQEEEVAPEPPNNVSVKKKFIITSSFNKSNTHGIVNAFFIQINKLKGRGISGEIRMPISSRDFSPEFWGWPNKYSVMHSADKGHKKCKKWQVTCRIIDVEDIEANKIDNIELFQEEGKTSFNFHSNALISLNPQENDIIRIIRCPEESECVFQCELIRSASKEYGIWEQFCSQVIKGTERRYGFA